VVGGSEDTHSRAPVVRPRINNNLIWEWICFQCGYGRNMIFLAVYDVDYFETGLLEGLFHGGADFDAVLELVVSIHF
jgi:hypothetical protein